MTDAAHAVPSLPPPSIDPSIFAALPLDIQTELRALHHVREVAPAPVYTISAPTPWVCHVCTFLNHPELAECEICGTLGCLSVAIDPEELPDVGSPASRLGRTWRKLASPVSLTFSQRREPGADDLLTAATTTLQLVKDSWTGRRSRTNSASGDKPMLVPTPQTRLELLELETDLTHKVVAGEAWFETSLERLWRVVSGRTEHEAYDRKGVDWVTLGFQNASPETDFRGGGRLAMKCLLYAFEAHPMEMRTIYYEQMPEGTKRWYPVCVAGINLTCLLARLLQLGDGKFADKKEVFWPLFEEPAAFYELYVLAFIKMNAIWHRLNATYMEFGVVLKATQKIVTYILEQGPATLVELREVSDQALVERFGASLSTRSLSDWEGRECPDSNHMLEMEDTLVISKTRPTSKSEPSIKGTFFWPLH